MNITKFTRALVAWGVLTLQPLWALAGTGTDNDPWTVCASGCDYTSVQSAVDNAALANGHFVEVQDAAHTESMNSVNHTNITIRAQSGLTVTWTNATAGDYCIQDASSASDGWIIDGFKFQGTGTNDDRGILLNTADDWTVRSCDFDNLRCAIQDNASGGGSGGTWQTIRVTNPQATQLLDAAFFLIDRDGVTIDDVIYDGRGVDATTWDEVFQVRSSNNLTVTNWTSYLDDNEDGRHIYFLNGGDTILVQDFYFEGGSTVAVYISGSDNTHAWTDHEFSYGQFVNWATYALEWENTGITTPGGFSRRLLVHHTDFYGDDTDSEKGLVFAEVTAHATAYANTFHDITEQGIYGQAPRYLNIFDNEFYNNVQPIGFAANSAVSGYHQYGSNIFNNLFDGDCADGCIHVQNFFGVSMPQDSLLSIGGNTYTNVTDVGRWTDTSNTITDFSTLALWQAELATHGNIKVHDLGSAEDPTDIARRRGVRAMMRGRF